MYKLVSHPEPQTCSVTIPAASAIHDPAHALKMVEVCGGLCAGHMQTWCISFSGLGLWRVLGSIPVSPERDCVSINSLESTVVLQFTNLMLPTILITNRVG